MNLPNHTKMYYRWKMHRKSVKEGPPETGKGESDDSEGEGEGEEALVEGGAGGGEEALSDLEEAGEKEEDAVFDALYSAQAAQGESGWDSGTTGAAEGEVSVPATAAEASPPAPTVPPPPSPAVVCPPSPAAAVPHSPSPPPAVSSPPSPPAAPAVPKPSPTTAAFPPLAAAAVPLPPSATPVLSPPAPTTAAAVDPLDAELEASPQYRRFYERLRFANVRTEAMTTAVYDAFTKWVWGRGCAALLHVVLIALDVFARAGRGRHVLPAAASSSPPSCPSPL